MKTISYLYTSVPVRVSRKQLEKYAINAICACWYWDLINTLERLTDTDLVKIIEREPCLACE